MLLRATQEYSLSPLKPRAATEDYEEAHINDKIKFRLTT